MNDFLRGISRGIFGEQERMRQEQLGKDTEKKSQIINLLTSLAPQVEPESLPLLLGHIGDTIGIKGKMRKFWDVFSGQPDLTPEAQMGDLVRKLSSQLTGPETARQARESYKGELLQPFRAQGTRPRSVEALPYRTPPSLQDRIVLRDPREEKLEELQTRFQGQLANQQAQTAFKEKLMLDRMTQLENQEQINRKEFADYKANIESEKGILERAKIIARGLGFTGDPPLAIKTQAAVELGREQGWSNDRLQSQIKFLNARALEAQANAQSVKQFGMKTGEAGRLDLSRKDFYDDQAKEYSNSLAQVKDSEARLKQIRDGIQKQKEANQARVASGDITQADADMANSFIESRERTRIADEEGKLAGARSRAQNAFNKLKDPENTYYRVGEFGSDIEAPKAIKPTTPQAPAPPSKGDVNNVGIGTNRQGAFILKEVPDPDNYSIDEIITDKRSRKKFRVVIKVGNTLYLTPDK